MRLPGCTSPVAGKSSSRIMRRGAKFMKDTPRSGSSVSTAPTRKRARPSSTAPPGRTLSAAIIRSSSQTVPRGGIASISASAVLRAGATRSLPRSGYPGVTALTAVSSASLPALAMLTKVTLSARARPSRMISSRNSGLQAWSAVISTSAPSTWCASRVSACRTRSAKKATLETPPTASTRASAKKHPEGETQHRRSSFAADAPRDEPDLPRATAGDRFVMGDKQKRRARFRVHLEHQVDHPSPGRGIEIAGRLVGEQELGLRDEGASERDALLLPSGKGLRVMPQALSEPHARKHSRRQIRRARSTRARSAARPSSSKPKRSAPSSRTRPELGVSRPARSPRSVDFPEPEAPTMATASPGMTLSEMSCKITSSSAPGVPFAAFWFSWTTFESPAAWTMGWEKSGMRSILFGALLACCGTAAAEPAILVYGDSLSSAYGVPQSAGWVALLGERLKQLKSNYTVVNASISGETSAGGAARIGRVLASTQPAIVIVELGANDGLRGLPVAQMKSNLAAIIQAAKRQGPRVILVGMQMPPNYGARYTNAFRDRKSTR